MRRMGSPQQVSSGPRMAKLTSASLSRATSACETFMARSSKAPAQPTQ